MKFVFAPDSFKGSLSALECCDLLEEAAAVVFPEAETVSVPVADGGEGTVEAIMRSVGGQYMETKVTGPLFEPVTAVWARLPDGTAVMEAAQASGLPLVPLHRRDPRYTTSLGTGQMIASALDQGIRKILIGIGGSATNDGGIGMLTALGAVFTDRDGQNVVPDGETLIRVAHADFSHLHPMLSETTVTVMCDVSNPLLGEKGATYIYGPQKGATPEIRDMLETGMRHYASVIQEALAEAGICRTFSDFPGAGAAGGLGAALGGVLGANMRSGIDAVLETVRFDQFIRDANLVVTGEGRIDAQTVRYGKVPAGVARHCAGFRVPVAVLTGSIGDGAEELHDLCECSIHAIENGPISLEQSMAQARLLYRQAAEQLFRTLKIGQIMLRRE